ncbi:MAG: hypothetical protein B7C54_11710 [Acidimicrobiales bacterium mtb01]|nr:hypothetical protein [Actinomycetota bacterium]TEX45712.1 MAG: hypothetical protein B7C54_11710 [Acidimicrobiales bacterium mtb01]
MTSDPQTPDCGETWLDVVAAVEYVAAAYRPGLTVWGALDEAVRWWMAARLDPLGEFRPSPTDMPWADPDPLRSSLREFLVTVGPVGSIGGHSLADALNDALDAWLWEMAKQFNDGHVFSRWRAREG